MAARFENLAMEYHAELLGLLRAALVDHGIAEDVLDRRLLGWDHDHLTVPVYSRGGRLSFLERWDPLLVGIPADPAPMVDLYPWAVLEGSPKRLFLVEGIHEALVLESQGFSAIAATGSGLFFKTREWTDALRGIPEVVLAYRRGVRPSPRRHLLSRAEVVAQASAALPNARVLEWPAEVGADGGGVSYFVTLGKTAADLEALLGSA